MQQRMGKIVQLPRQNRQALCQLELRYGIGITD
jgi:hypothetical protein